ncbi:MAG: hypothetical protein DDT37_01647 [Firmicutes bacterium]|nr:hypothetical protein [candidate division NPL-UPA2 bacterium]
MLIDYENVYWSLKNTYGFCLEPGMLVDGVRNLVGRKGHIVLMLAYADFDHPDFKGRTDDKQRPQTVCRLIFVRRGHSLRTVGT